MPTAHAYAAHEPGGKLEPFEYELGDIAPGEVELEVQFCGICHSDLSMLDGEWGMSEYPFVPGHEVIGRIAAVGAAVEHLDVGQTVGLGWTAQSCLHCRQCLGGDHNLCRKSVGTIVGRHGGFADRVRCQAIWAFSLPDDLDPAKAGPLFCGGVTVFNPIIQNGIRGTDRVGVIGIGGLGHMALTILDHWGCEVTAFSTSPDKEDEARALGADHFVNSRDEETLEELAGCFDMILSTVNVPLPWDAYVKALAPRGTLHLVGAAPKLETAVFPLISGQKSVGGSPTGSPTTIAAMLDFCARHDIEPMTEHFDLSDVNKAIDRLRSGDARYRLVLEN